MNRHTKAFTLIELLVVISIIALLMSIMMPALAQVKKIAQATICMSNLRHWGVVGEMFSGDNNGEAPSGFYYELHKYYKDLKLLLCPSAKKKGTLEDWDDPGHFKGGTFKAWFVPEVEFPDGIVRDVKCSYGKNAHVGGTGNNETDERTDWRTTRQKGIDRAPFLADGAGGGVPLPEDDPPDYDGETYFSDPMDINEIRNFCINRHPAGTVNVLFLDWHARKVGLKELWVLKWHRRWPRGGDGGTGDAVPLPDWPPWMERFRNP